MGGRGRATGSNRYQWRWMYRKRGGGRGSDAGGERPDPEIDQNQESNQSTGRGRGFGRTRGSGYQNFRGYRGKRGGGHSSYNQTNDSEPPPVSPPKKKRRITAVESIQISVEKQWRQILPGYDLYYPAGPPQLSEIEKKIDAITNYLIDAGLKDLVSASEDKEVEFFPVCCDEVLHNRSFLDCWPEFESELIDDSKQIISLWGVTAHKIVFDVRKKIKKEEQDADSDDDDDDSSQPVSLVPKIQIGFLKTDPITPLIEIKATYIDKFITIRGAIVRTGNIHPYFVRLMFRCKVCDAVFACEQPEGKYTPPNFCKASEDCTNKTPYLFEPLETHSSNVLLDSRRIRIQDVQHRDRDMERERGSVPRTIDCELFGSLTTQCNTGDAVTLSGVVKMCKDAYNGGEQSLHHIYIEASGVKQHKDSERTMGGHLFSFTNKDYYAIKEIHDTPNLFRLLIASLCPSIYGHELVKAGMLLCLFGGSPHFEGIVPRRSDINMLMVGDPGIGKSQMLRVLNELSPRAVYVCGTASTVAGLTVTLVKDGDDYSLEAGALVMADQGVCCIDEFDKMSSQHHALLEAMEQQSVSIAKSGVFRTLPARATVIAAANPVGGHYDPCKTVVENIKINTALMSRFDLIFILLDKPDEVFDQQIVEHMMGARKVRAYAGQAPKFSSNFKANVNSEDNIQLIEKIKIRPGEVMDIIPPVLLRKYIAYAKYYVHPQLSPEARELLQKYYLNLRLSYRGNDSTPVTVRQLESLVRLTEARAKMELRVEATAEDASDILEIFEFSLDSALDKDVHAVSALSNRSILLNTSVGGGRSKSQSIISQSRKLLSVLQTTAQRQSKNIFSVDEIKSLVTVIGLNGSADSLIAALNNEGCLLKKGNRIYQLQTIDF